MAKLNLRSNRKFRRLCGMARLDSEAHVRGHLSALWEASWENGTPLLGDLDDVEMAADWPTANPDKYPRGAFASALVLAGFVDEVVPGKLYAIHDWWEHAPRWVHQRIGRELERDATVGPETYFLGLVAWARRAKEVGLEVDTGGVIESADDAPENGATANGGQRPPKPEFKYENGGQRPPKPEINSENGGLSRQGKSREGKRRTSPPPSPLSPPPPPPPISTPEAAALWRVAREHARLGVRDRHEFDTWLRPLVPLEIDGSTLRLHAPNARFVHTLEEDYKALLSAAVELAAGHPMNLSIGC